MILRNHVFAITGFLALAATGHAAGAPSLALSDVNSILGQAAQAATIYSPNSVIAVTDREGFVLGVYGVAGPPSATQTANAIAKAGRPRS